jgi:hypothetical protein
MKNLFNVFLISLLFYGCQSNTEQKPKILKYQIAKQQDISFMNIPKMVYRIMLDVDSTPMDIEMRNTATYLWQNGNRNWEEFTVFIYLPFMNTESPAFGVVEFNKEGLVMFTKNEDALYGTKWAIKDKNEEAKEIKLTTISDKEIKEIPNTRIKEYRVELIPTNAGERKVKINIVTNFPDGTIFNLSINRNYYVVGDNETYIGELYDKDFSVQNGKFETIINIINDTEWYNERQKLVKNLPNDFSPISKISDKITINVLYTPAQTQPANVLKILGTKGEFITGKGAEKFGTGTLGQLTSFSVSEELVFPFKK